MIRSASFPASIEPSVFSLPAAKAHEAVFFTMYISPREYPLAVELIAAKTVDVEGLITHRFRLVDFERALQTVSNPAEQALKVVITK